MEKVNYVQYVSWKKELLYEGVEPKEEVLFCKSVYHDSFELEFITSCTVEDVIKQIDHILSGNHE